MRPMAPHFPLLRYQTILVLAFFCCIHAKSQSEELLDSLFTEQLDSTLLQYVIDNASEDYNKLLIERGVEKTPLETGNIRESLQGLLRSYQNRNVGILLYNYRNDTLTTALVANSGDIVFHRNAVSKEELCDAIRDARQYLSGEVLTIRGARPPESQSQQLGKNAYRYVNDILLPFRSKMVFDHLVVVPTLNIGTFPFSALKLNDSTYLIDKMSYSVSYGIPEIFIFKSKNAAQMGVPFRNRASHEHKNFLVRYTWTNALFIANPAFPEQGDYLFMNLPGTMREVERITASLPDSTYSVLSGEEATHRNVTSLMKQPDLLYFATHGISSSSNSLDSSYLVLAREEGQSAFLTAREIQELSRDGGLKADLVVLSACQTGLGKIHEGGIIGLSRAFQIAGAEHVVMSLWSIDDSETATLMGYFFENLTQADYLLPHEAMRAAILRFKSEVNPDPKYWASFSIFGIPY